MFAALIGVTVLNGISGIIISRFDRPVWSHHRIVTGVILSVTGAAEGRGSHPLHQGMINNAAKRGYTCYYNDEIIKAAGAKDTVPTVRERSGRQKDRGLMEIKWKDDFEIRVRIEGGTAVISANRDGLLSLAEQFMTLAGEDSGSHIHYDEYNSLENGSDELIIEKI